MACLALPLPLLRTYYQGTYRHKRSTLLPVFSADRIYQMSLSTP